MEKEAEVVVIGGGISGCATAYNLAKRGAKVILLEKGKLADEASGRTMGVVRQQGRQACEIPLMMESINIWGHLSEELQSEVDFIKGGNVWLAETPQDLEEMEESVKASQNYGLDSKMITLDEVRKLVPTLENEFLAAMHSPRDGHADPVKTVLAFARAAQEHGAHIYENCAVQNIELQGGKIDGVLTDDGEIKTPTVVCVAGVWSAKLARMVGLQLPVKVGRFAMAATEPRPPLFKAFLWGPRLGVRQTVDGSLHYCAGFRDPLDYDFTLDSFRDLRLWMPNLVKNRGLVKINVGSDLLKDLARTLPGSPTKKNPFAFSTGMEPKVNHKLVNKHLRLLEEFMPTLKGIKTVRTWSGLIDLTPDLIPILGNVERPRGFIIGAGFSGHGFALGPITGRIMSELALDGKTALPIEPFRYSRFIEGDYHPPEKLI